MKPVTYVFPGVVDGHRVDAPASDKIVWHACKEAAKRAGIAKCVHPHTLRHYAEFRTMPSKLSAPCVFGFFPRQDSA
jgi:integrase